MSELYKTEKYLAPTLILDFDINADKISVFNAWTEIETFKKWFCPTGFSIAKAELVPEKGGHFIIHMKSPEGEIYPTKGEFILLQKPDRIVYKDSWDDDRVNNTPVVAELRFETFGAKTRVKLYSSFATEKQKEETLKSGMIDGWKMFFENLNNVLNQE
ncbi:MAG: hypothetical protein ACI9IP_001191 [Arcticibacterium sp.]|jgi:uncharacterized protein YndB with AHSA1/START domain